MHSPPPPLVSALLLHTLDELNVILLFYRHAGSTGACYHIQSFNVDSRDQIQAVRLMWRALLLVESLMSHLCGFLNFDKRFTDGVQKDN